MKKNPYPAILLLSCILYSCGLIEVDVSEEAVRMQQFVQDISGYAKSIKPGFIIIPQNGAELAFNETELKEGVLMPYINAIDGIGIEELFYDGSLSVDKERLNMLRILKNHVPVIIADYVKNDANIPDAVRRSREEGFIAFPRGSKNYDYMLIPELTDANEKDINDLSDAENFLYLISTEKYNNKNEMLTAIVGTNYDVVLIDLFFEDDMLAPSDIDLLKIKKNGKKRLVISYISIGSAENYRYYWKKGWKKGSPSWLKKRYEGYPDEYWVEFWKQQWQDIIYSGNNSYIDRIINAGFDGAYLDNVEAYYFLKNK